jgi:hypothetical protein
METSAFLDRLDALLVPSEYRTKVGGDLPPGWRLYRKGAYLFAAVPYTGVPKGDYANARVKAEVRRRVLALPLVAEKGLFLLYYGAAADWGPHRERHRVDATALRPVITQAVHFVDPLTGDHFSRRSAWGPVRFGFAGPVVGKVERLCETLRRPGGATSSPA